MCTCVSGFVLGTEELTTSGHFALPAFLQLSSCMHSRGWSIPESRGHAGAAAPKISDLMPCGRLVAGLRLHRGRGGRDLGGDARGITGLSLYIQLQFLVAPESTSPTHLRRLCPLNPSLSLSSALSSFLCVLGLFPPEALGWPRPSSLPLRAQHPLSLHCVFQATEPQARPPTHTHLLTSHTNLRAEKAQCQRAAASVWVHALLFLLCRKEHQVPSGDHRAKRRRPHCLLGHYLGPQT